MYCVEISGFLTKEAAEEWVDNYVSYGQDAISEQADVRDEDPGQYILDDAPVIDNTITSTLLVRVKE